MSQMDSQHHIILYVPHHLTYTKANVSICLSVLCFVCRSSGSGPYLACSLLIPSGWSHRSLCRGTVRQLSAIGARRCRVTERAMQAEAEGQQQRDITKHDG